MPESEQQTQGPEPAATLRDLPYTVAELAELRAIWEPVRPDTHGLAGGYARLMVLRFLATLDRLEAAEAALREVPWWPLYDSAHGDPRSEQINDWYEKHSDLIHRLSQPHSAEPTGTLRERLRATAIRDARTSENRPHRLHPWDPQPVATPNEERKLDSLAQPHSAEGGRNE